MKTFLLPLLLIASPALADPFTYAPKDCEFQITFPEKPFIETKCTKDGTTDKDICSDIVTYTKTIGTKISTNFRVSCNPIDKSEKYTPEIIEATLKEVIKAAGFEPYEINSREKDGYKSASSISFSTKNDLPVLYNAQLWMGKTSMFTIEADMRGEQNSVIEETFATILRNTYPKDKPPTPPKEKSKEKATEETPKKKE